MEALFYRGFKAKYFPNFSIFEANSSSSSYAWKSILRSQILIDKWARWRIGDVKSIWIFQDAWLLTTKNGIISSPQTLLHPEAFVNSLINLDTIWWNTHLIDICFYPPKAQHIKSLPLCSTP